MIVGKFNYLIDYSIARSSQKSQTQIALKKPETSESAQDSSLDIAKTQGPPKKKKREAKAAKKANAVK